MQVSALTKMGLTEAWAEMQEYHSIMIKSKLFIPKRARQHRIWMWNHIQDNIMEIFRQHPDVKPEIPRLEDEVTKGRITSGMAADALLGKFRIRVAKSEEDL